MKRLIKATILALTMSFAATCAAPPSYAVPLPDGVVRHAADDGYDGGIWVQCRANNAVRSIQEGYDSRDYCPGAGRVVYIIVRYERQVTCQNGKVYRDKFPSTTDRYHVVGVDEYVGGCTHKLFNY